MGELRGTLSPTVVAFVIVPGRVSSYPGGTGFPAVAGGAHASSYLYSVGWLLLPQDHCWRTDAHGLPARLRSSGSRRYLGSCRTWAWEGSASSLCRWSMQHSEDMSPHAPSFDALRSRGRLVRHSRVGALAGYHAAPDSTNGGLCKPRFRAWSVLAWVDGEVATRLPGVGCGGGSWLAISSCLRGLPRAG